MFALSLNKQLDSGAIELDMEIVSQIVNAWERYFKETSISCWLPNVQSEIKPKFKNDNDNIFEKFSKLLTSSESIKIWVLFKWNRKFVTLLPNRYGQYRSIHWNKLLVQVKYK